MPYKLLLADDSVTIQRVIELTFADEDVKVTAVGDGQQAIDRILSDRPDIVLADVGMPGRDGYEVAAFIKQDPSLAHIPVLLLTGAFEPVDEDRSRAVRCDGVLAKPFEPQLLIGRVKELLKDTTPSAAEPAAPTAVETIEADAAGSPAGPAEPAAFPAFAATGAIDIDEDATVKMVRAPLAAAEGEPALEVEALDLRSDPASTEAGTLDDYFDRLDAAFAHLTGGQSAREGGLPRPVADPWAVAARPDFGWPQDPSLSTGAAADGLDPDRRPPAIFGEGPGPDADSSPADALDALASVPPAGAASSPGLVAVPLPEAFAALLAAERDHGPEAVLRGRSAAVPTVLLPGSPITDAVIDDVARRVVERLGEPAFREIVREVVSTLAERLIREEIERIKATVEGK